MTLDRSWQFVGGLDSWPYRLFDLLRRRLNRRLVRYLMQQLGDPRAGRSLRVLEPGCGTGFALSLVQRYRDVQLAVAVDMDELALREGRRQNPDLRAVVGNLYELPFRNDAFDLVYNSSTVEHLEHATKAVCEMQRVCAERGRVFVGVPYLFGPLGFQRVIRRSRLGHWLGPVFTRDSLAALLRRAHLEPIRWQTYFWRCFIGVVGWKES